MMFFRCLNIAEVIFHDLNDKDEVVFQPSKDFQVLLRKLTKEELEAVKIYYMSAFAVTVINDRDVPRKVREVFDSLAQHRLPEGTERHPGDEAFINADGTFKSESVDEEGIRVRLHMPLAVFIRPFQVFVEQLNKELTEYTNNFVKTLRWRGNGSGPFRPIQRTATVEWSFDKEDWHLLPEVSRPTVFEYTTMLKTDDAVKADVENYVGGEVDEPLSHELLYEAWSQRMESPRSALILAMAAAEVGLKYCIATLVPDSLWIVTNIPSPPLVKMLLEYLPTLPAKCTVGGKVLSPPASIIEELKKGVTLRNQVVHNKIEILEHDTLRKILLSVQSTLWLLDYYSGFEWAWENIDTITKGQLERSTR